jgi:cytochrome c peroxidase
VRYFVTAIFFIGVLILTGFKFPGKKNKITEVQLGEKLFHDPILSSDLTVSCATCHKPEFAFADTSALSVGVGGKLGTRNTPSAMNMAMRDHYFWDGRAASLEAQASGPVSNPVEMNLPFKEAVMRVRNHKVYRALFRQVYGRLPDSARLVKAIAAFEKSLETFDTPNDRWLNDLPNGLNPEQLRGRVLFMSNRTRCFDCHFTPDFTGDEFRNIGLFNGREWNDSGRYVFTKNLNDIGKFKVPGLRNVAVTAPYMHNGKFKTLREVIDYYNEPAKVVPDAVLRDTILPRQLHLSETEKQDLEAFLVALTDERFRRLLKN